MDHNNAMSLCFKNKIKCYPVYTITGVKIEYIINNKAYKFDKVLNGHKEINNAIVKSYVYLCKKYCQDLVVLNISCRLHNGKEYEQ